jgi:tRNA G37 N-methylase Trm5
LQSIIQYSHQLLAEIIQQGDIVIDATCGNGHDTVFLSKKVKESGKVYAFDIQEQAIKNTKKKLDDASITNVSLIHDSHEHVKAYISEHSIAGAIFNLGYLPKGDHHIITTPSSTLAAIESILPLLKVRGRLVLVIYHGHEGGKDEKNAVIDYCAQLNQKYFQVLQYQFINQVNEPPFIIAIEKVNKLE